MQQLTFTIKKDGTVTVHVEGASGESCVKLTQPIEQALGGAVDRQVTDEYYRQDNSIDQQAGGGYGQ